MPSPLLVIASATRQSGVVPCRTGLLRRARIDARGSGRTSFGRYVEQGFTLVELMVVLALLGLAAAAVVLTMPSAGGGAVTEATRFAARVAALRDRSVIEGRGHGLWVTASGYGFERRGNGEAGPMWQPLEDGRLSRDDWRPGTAVSIDGAVQGRLAFDRVGLPDRAMRIAFRSGETTAEVSIDPAGEVTVR